MYLAIRERRKYERSWTQEQSGFASNMQIDNINTIVCRFVLEIPIIVHSVCVFSSSSFWTSMDVPAGVTQEEGNTGFSIPLSAVLALIFLARRIQPFLSLVDREVDFCVLTN